MNAVNPIPTPAAGAEPSMEEILASIRRIIADDQPLGAAAADAAADPLQKASDPAPADFPAPHVPPAESRLKPMPPEHGSIASPQFPTPDGTPGVKDAPHPLAPSVSEPAIASVPKVAATPDSAYEISAPEPDVHEAALRALHDEPGTREAVLGTDAYEARIHEARVDKEQVRELLEHQVPPPAIEEAPMSLREPPVSQREQPEEPAAAGLFSAATSQSLAAAFNTLAISRLADDSRELRGLAREMLRPLLKDWLDAHLPGLVESIIREEIERMARRGR